MRSDSSRRSRGAQKIGEVLGKTPEQVERSLGDIAPQLATYVLETIYGDIYESPTLDVRTRQIVTVAALATLGTAAPQVRTHIGGAPPSRVGRRGPSLRREPGGTGRNHDAARAICRRRGRDQRRRGLPGGVRGRRQVLSAA